MAVPTKTLDYVEDWLDDELRNYVYEKFNEIQDREHVRHFSEAEVGQDTWWDIQLHQYLDRAKLIELNNPNGRQALGKFVATAIGMLVAAVDEYGELPRAGVSSGNNLDDLVPLL